MSEHAAPFDRVTLLDLYRQVRGLIHDYEDTGRDVIASMPFKATLDQIMTEHYRISLDAAFHQVGHCPVCGAAILDSGYDDDPEKWWHDDPMTHSKGRLRPAT